MEVRDDTSLTEAHVVGQDKIHCGSSRMSVSDWQTTSLTDVNDAKYLVQTV